MSVPTVSVCSCYPPESLSSVSLPPLITSPIESHPIASSTIKPQNATEQTNNHIFNIFLSVIGHLFGFLSVSEFTNITCINKAISPYSITIDRVWHNQLVKLQATQQGIQIPNLAAQVNPTANGDSYRLYKQIVQLKTPFCFPPILIQAIDKRYTELAAALLRERVWVNYVGKPKLKSSPIKTICTETALTAAINQHLPEITQLLLTAKADPNVRTTSTYSLKQYDLLGKQTVGEDYSSLRRKWVYASNTHPPLAGEDASTALFSVTFPLNLAAAQGCTPTVDALLASKAEIDRVDGFGMTPLLNAAFNGHAAVVETLLKAKANPDSENILKKTAHMYAQAQNKMEIAMLLEQAGAKITEEKTGWVESISQQPSLQYIKWKLKILKANLSKPKP